MSSSAPSASKPAPSTIELRLDVTGMTCAACQAHVQRSLALVPGVLDASVSLLGNSARVRIDPARVGSEEVLRAVEDSGYTAALPPAGRGALAEEDARAALEEREYAELRRHALAALGAGLVVMVASLPLMSGTEHAHAADPLMAWAMERVDPAARVVLPWLFAIDTRVLAGFVLVLTTFVLAWAGRRFFVRAWSSLANRTTDMNTLIATGTGAAWAWSLVATLFPGWFRAHGLAPEVYWEAVVFLVALVLLGNLLEHRARRRTTDALRALVRLQPARARVERGGKELEIALEDVCPGEVVLARPGERLAVDGVVVGGASAVDEAILTGESMPVAKSAGDAVIGGSMNGTGALRYRATTLGADSVLARIVELVKSAQASRAPIQQFADRVSAVFVPTVIGIALATFAAWFTLGGEHALPRAVAAAVAVLVIACPCAMGLAVPTAIVVASGRGAREGILVRGGAALQRAGEVDTVVFDKTGTLTEGRPAVERIVLAPDVAIVEDELLRLTASLEASSEHPLAGAIVRAADERGLARETVEAFASRPGRGAEARVGGKRVLAGNATYLREEGVAPDPFTREADAAAERGATCVYVAIDGRLAGLITARDPLRPEARAVVAELRAMGLDVVLLSGDQRRTAEAIAREAGIERVVADVLPEGKVAELERLQREGRVVAMAGDGVNDAPALARADLGIALGAGADVAVQASDVTLMRPDLHGVARTIRLSRRALATMRQNLYWAFGYNVVMIPIAAGALHPAFGVQLSPVLASGAMALSSVSVVLNSLRLARARLEAAQR
ncbi:MAG: copper-translocating P-type ATPase [Planctomycetes bacterium]|nr:copper-translocating P-type ATPase [Planctomycetota bacterium]